MEIRRFAPEFVSPASGAPSCRPVPVSAGTKLRGFDIRRCFAQRSVGDIRISHPARRFLPQKPIRSVCHAIAIRRKDETVSEDSTQTASKADVERLAAAIEKLVARLETADAKPEDLGEMASGHRVKETINAMSEQITEYVETHPVRASVIAFLVGVLIASRGHR